MIDGEYVIEGESLDDLKDTILGLMTISRMVSIDAPIGIAGIRQFAAMAGWTEGQADQAVRELLDDGEIVEVRKGTYGRRKA